jgi:holo-[acyl-carrier protein] synthase
MILGIGLDVVPIERMQRMLDRYGERIQERLFSPGEREFCARRGHPAQHFAARFAAKEGVLKALGAPAGLSWHEMEVRVEASGEPRLCLHGQARLVATARGVRSAHLSLTHAGGIAAAVVVLEGEPPIANEERTSL